MNFRIAFVASIVTLLSLRSSHAQERVFDDWWTDFPCLFHPGPPPDPDPIPSVSSPDFDVEFKERDPFIRLWTLGSGREALRAGMLTISVDGHAFPVLHPELSGNSNWQPSINQATEKLPIAIFNAMHDGQTLRIEYRQHGREPLVMEQSLKGFGEAADRCPYTEQLRQQR